jgi:hypothetical protein
MEKISIRLFTMFNKIIVGLVTVSLIVTFNPVFAQPNLSPVDLITNGTNKTLMLPVNADHSPVISLGSAVDSTTGDLVQGYAFIHYRDAFAKGGGHGGGGTVCYGYLASGAKWKTVEPWIMNTANNFGLSDSFLITNQTANIAKWEDATDGVIGNDSGINILGSGSSVGDVLVADEVAPDNLNEVYFGAISDPNAIAVTIVWGVFGGPPAGRKLTEWDQVFNQAYNWSATGEADKMDFENISTHELGHSVGMDDLYTSACVNETMYGYADNGQTNKRDLNSGDITGINKLY